MNRLPCPFLLAAAATLWLPLAAVAGPTAGPGIDRNDPRITGWATSVVNTFVRGPQDLAVPGSPAASFGAPENALGFADAPDDFTKVVSLGDRGSITLGFDTPITDTPGPDLAVFENGFPFNGQIFGELAFVEVSTDGVNFFRFAAESRTPTATQVGAFGTLDPAEINNLAGEHGAGVGTPFDLAELVGVSPLLDVDDVNFVRIIDVVGSIDPALGSTDSLGNLINDPYPTASAGGGFDLDAVAVLGVVPEPSGLVLALAGCAFTARGRRQG